MKKLIIIPLLLIALICKAQTMQNIISEFDGKVFSCIDTTERSDYGCDIFLKVDSVDLGSEYRDFVSMLESACLHDITRFVCQLTLKQTGDLDNPKRVVFEFIAGGFPDRMILNYNSLSSSDKKKFDNFINKIKGKL